MNGVNLTVFSFSDLYLILFGLLSLSCSLYSEYYFHILTLKGNTTMNMYANLKSKEFRVPGANQEEKSILKMVHLLLCSSQFGNCSFCLLTELKSILRIREVHL